MSTFTRLICCGAPAVGGVEHSEYSPSLQTDPRYAERAKQLAKTFSTLTPAKVIGRDEPLLVNLECLEDEEAKEEEPISQPELLSAGPTPRLHSKFIRISSSKQLTASDVNWTESRRVLQTRIDDAIRSNTEGDDEMPHEQRLNERLERLGLDMHVVAGDGNCQFRSVSNELYGTQEYHKYVRRKACQHIRMNRDYFEGFLGEDFDVYVQQMAKVRTWGDELTLRAICDHYGIVVNIVTSDIANWYLKYEPKALNYDKEVFLTYIAPVHYNAIRRRGTTENAANSFTSRINRSVAGSYTSRRSNGSSVLSGGAQTPRSRNGERVLSDAAMSANNAWDPATVRDQPSETLSGASSTRASYAHFPRLAHVQTVRDKSGKRMAVSKVNSGMNPAGTDPSNMADGLSVPAEYPADPRQQAWTVRVTDGTGMGAARPNVSAPVAPVAPGSANGIPNLNPNLKSNMAAPHRRSNGSGPGATVQFADPPRDRRSSAAVSGINTVPERTRPLPVTLDAPAQHYPVRSRR